MSSRTRYELCERIRTEVTRLAATLDLELAAADLDHIAPYAYVAFCRMQDARPGLPGAQAYDAPSVSGGSSSGSHPERMAEQDDPTEADRVLLDRTLAHLWLMVRPDTAIVDPVEVARIVTRDCLTLRRLIDAWTPRPASDKQRNAVTRANDPEAECAHHRTFGTFEPVHRTTDGGGLLNVKTPLCRWCHDRLRTDGVLPSADRMQRLADGRGDRVRA